MYVTVQPGVTWEELDIALRSHNLITPFWGPFSGKFATIGGSISQNAASFGSAKHGPSGNSLTGVEVVVADGRVIRVLAVSLCHNLQCSSGSRRRSTGIVCFESVRFSSSRCFDNAWFRNIDWNGRQQSHIDCAPIVEPHSKRRHVPARGGSGECKNENSTDFHHDINHRTRPSSARFVSGSR